ncbi:hypothetical protein SLS62_002313 [Diatrype stigma]|uniref:Uncharacterized protein n=1 Tax=Diatrype stigma TaxID=117547 RepID=A0AAN9YV33_9PEZI
MSCQMQRPQKERLTIKTDGKTEDKPATSPALSIDSGVGIDSPVRLMVPRDHTFSATEVRGDDIQAPLESPVTVLVNSACYTPAQIEGMARDLAQARTDGEFPRTTTPGYYVQATVEDHARLVRLREVHGGVTREKWSHMREATELFVEFARQIKERDGLRDDQEEATTIEGRIKKMIRGCHGEANLYALVNHAVHHAVQNHAVKQDLATGGITLSRILDLIRGVIREQADTGRHGVTEENMETVLEDVFEMIEHALIDATGPLRINVNRLDNITGAQQGQVEDLNNITTAQQTQVNALDMIKNAQQGHVNAIGTHVSAIGTQVGALGLHIDSMSGNVNSVAGNVQAMTTQVTLLQTIVSMLPEVIARAVEEALPQALHEALVPIVTTRVDERFGARAANKRGFFKRVFGVFSKGRGAGGAY